MTAGIPVFILLAIGPILAMIVESLNPISEAMIRKSVEDDLRTYEQRHHEQLVDDATKLTVGAVEVTGLAPTVVSVFTTAFAILHEVERPFFPMLGVFVLFVIILLVVVRLLGGLTFVQIETTRQPYNLPVFGEVTLPWSASRMVSLLIYLSNSILILVAGLTVLFGTPAEVPLKQSIFLTFPSAFSFC